MTQFDIAMTTILVLEFLLVFIFITWLIDDKKGKKK